MIFGRPVNLWLGLATAIQGAVAVTAVALGADAAIVATISGAWGAVFGAIMVDPFPGHKAIVIVREGGTTGSWSLDELSVESTIDPVLRLHPGDFTNYVPARRTTTFTGKAVA